MKEIEVEIKLRNNRLLQRRRELGLTQAELGERVGITAHTVGQYETMNMHPISTRDADLGWKPSALSLAEFFAVDPWELFPEAIQQIRKSSARIEVDAADVGRLLDGPSHVAELPGPAEAYDAEELRAVVDDALDTLSPRERRVIDRRFGLDGEGGSTLEEVAEEFGVGTERIRQIEAKAIRRMRHPAVSRPLAEFDTPGRGELRRRADVQRRLLREQHGWKWRQHAPKWVLDNVPY
jgi:transcriptional regulator with XRE-family HTH domain